MAIMRRDRLPQFLYDEGLIDERSRDSAISNLKKGRVVDATFQLRLALRGTGKALTFVSEDWYRLADEPKIIPKISINSGCKSIW